MIYSEILGRDEILDRLELQANLLINGKGSLVNIAGEPGVGKSRLIAELKKKEVVGRVKILEGKAAAGNENLNFYPISRFLRQWAGIGDDDGESRLDKLEKLLKDVCPEQSGELLPFTAKIMGVELSDKRVGKTIGRQGEYPEERIIKSLRTPLREASRKKPLIIILDDMHWADASSVQLLEALFGLAEKERIMFVNLFRPSYGHRKISDRLLEIARDDYSEIYLEINLEPLIEKDSEKMAGNLLGDGDAPAFFKRRVADASGGNPSFIEEIIRSLIDRGTLVKNKGRFEFREDPKEIVIPRSVNEALTLRLDELDEETRRLVEAAAVIGRSFSRDILRLVADDVKDIDGKLLYLENVQLIRKNESRGEVEYLFKHGLTMEVACRSISERDKKDSHFKTARAVEEVFKGNKRDYHGLLAYHYVRAEELDKAEEHMLKAGAEAMSASASSEGLYYYRSALEIFLKKHGDKADPEKALKLKTNILEAMFNRGDMESIEYSESVLEYYGVRIPQEGRRSYPRLIGSLFSSAARIWLPFRRKKPDSLDLEKLRIISRRIRSVYPLNLKKAITELIILLLGNLAKLDISKERSSLTLMVVNMVWFLNLRGGALALYMSRKILAWARPRLSKSDKKLLLAYETVSTQYNLFAGEWDSINSYDRDLTERNLKMGEIRSAAFYVANYGAFALLRGQTDFFDVIDRMDVVVREYNDNVSKFMISRILGVYLAFCGKAGHERAVRKLEKRLNYIRRKRLTMPHIHIGYIILYIKLLREERAEAEELFEEMESLTSKVPALSILSSALVSKVKFYFFLVKLERGVAGNDSSGFKFYRRLALKIGREALRISKKIAIYRTETLRFMGVYHWLTGGRSAALKWFGKSVKEGERKGARLELSRTYFEIGSRLSEKNSVYKELNSIGAEEYLRKAKLMFEEMGLAWDLEQLDKFQLVNKDKKRKTSLSKVEKLETIIQLNTLLLSRSNDFKTILDVILRETKDIFNAESGLILLKNEESSVLSLYTASGFEKNISVDREKGIYGEVLDSGVPEIENNVARNLFFREMSELAGLETKNLMAAPLKANESSIGVLAVVNKKEGNFYVDELNFFQFAADQISIILERAGDMEKKIKAGRLAGIGETVAGLSHYIRNILNGLKGGAGVIDRYIDNIRDEKIKTAWNIITPNIARISDLVINMLEYSGERELAFRPTDLNFVVRDIIELLEYDDEYKDAKIELDLQPDLGEIEIDRERTHRCLLNLIKNALEATEGQETRNVVVTTRKRGGRRVDIKVWDNGRGIEKNDMERLFVKFFTTKKSKGTGLGLPIVQKIVDEHKGKLRVSSEPGSHSLFTISLPVVHD